MPEDENQTELDNNQEQLVEQEPKPSIAEKTKDAALNIGGNIASNAINNGFSNKPKEGVGSKLASGALQATGVPKPVADLGGKAASHIGSKINPANKFKQNNSNNQNINKNLNNGLKSAKNTNPSNQKNNIGKGSHPNNTPNNLGRNKPNNNNSQQNSSLPKKGGLDNNNVFDPTKQIKNILGFGDSKPPEDAPQSVKLAYKTKKIARIFRIIGPILPILILFITIVFVAFLVMGQVMIVRDKINSALIGTTTGIEKFVNYFSGNGWNTEEDKFYNTLKEKYNKALKEPTKDGKPLVLDIPLIAATINYSKVSNIGIYDDKEKLDLGNETDGSAEDLFGNFFDPYIEVFQTRSFYYVANDKLGDYHTLVPGHRRLLGHLVDYEITWDTYNITDAGTVATKWIEFFKFFADSAGSDLETSLGINFNYTDLIPGVVPIKAIFNFVNQIYRYEQMGDKHDSYFEYHARNIIYELEELIYKCGNLLNDESIKNNASTDTSDKDDKSLLSIFNFIPAPTVTFYKTIDMNKPYEYGDYLKNVYIPGTFFSDEYDYDKQLVDRMVRDIYDQQKFYIHLLGDIENEQNGNLILGSNCDNCTYNLSKINTSSSVMSQGDEFANMNNIKVKLVAWYDTSNRGKVMAEGIDFEKYILGVTYAEVGESFPPEALKAEAVAARSFSLTRPFAMGNSEYCNFKKEGDGWVLTLRGATADQVYCDPDQGCSSDISSFNDADIYPGLDKPYIYKVALANTSDQGQSIKAAVAETTGQVIIDASGNITSASYLNSDQESWKARALNGELYTSILPSHYTAKYGQTISLASGNCTKSTSAECSTGEATGDWATWRQYDARWGDVPLGSDNIHDIGCTATSIAIQLARSKAQVTFGEINPGTFVTAYTNVGGFDANGSIDFTQVYKVAPNFKYVSNHSLLNINKDQKISILKELVEQGYYGTMEVKKGLGQTSHWVAVVKVDNDKVIMADPASDETNVETKYPAEGWSDFHYYEIVR